MATKRRTHQRGLRTRQNFARIPSIVDIPNLIEVQQRSYERFLQHYKAPGKRELVGLEEVFQSPHRGGNPALKRAVGGSNGRDYER